MSGFSITDSTKQRLIEDLIEYYKLQPHPEGGYFAETFRDELCVKNSEGKIRSASTAIMFLISEHSCSRLHRIKSDEVWHFYSGDSMTVVELDVTSKDHCRLIKLGSDFTKGEKVQYAVKAGMWFGSYANEGSAYSLVGCTVAPGFDFEDFELGSRKALTEQFPLAQGVIEKLTVGIP